MNESEKTPAKDERTRFRELVRTYLNTMCAGDEGKFLEIWHPDARRFSIGNSNELNSFGLAEIVEYSLEGIMQLRKELPKSSKLQQIIDEVLHLSIYNNLVAAVEVNGT